MGLGWVRLCQVGVVGVVWGWLGLGEVMCHGTKCDGVVWGSGGGGGGNGGSGGVGSNPEATQKLPRSHPEATQKLPRSYPQSPRKPPRSYLLRIMFSRRFTTLSTRGANASCASANFASPMGSLFSPTS